MWGAVAAFGYLMRASCVAAASTPAPSFVPHTPPASTAYRTGLTASTKVAPGAQPVSGIRLGTCATVWAMIVLDKGRQSFAMPHDQSRRLVIVQPRWPMAQTD